MGELIAVLVLGGIFYVIGVGMYGVLGGFDKPVPPMTYDEEMDWLMNDQGLSEEEAKKIAGMH